MSKKHISIIHVEQPITAYESFLRISLHVLNKNSVLTTDYSQTSIIRSTWAY